MKKAFLIISVVFVSLISNGQMFYGHNQTSVAEQLGYGLLYNWYAASDANFAPTGWHVPTNTELAALKSYLTANGHSGSEGGALKETGTTHWLSPNTGAIDAFNFSAIPGGYRSYTYGSFTNINYECYLMTKSEYNPYQLYYWILKSGNDDMVVGYTYGKSLGGSVRLIKDDSTNPGTITDYDGNAYDCVTIGAQVWIAQNWHCKHLNNGTAIPEVTDNSTWAGLTTRAWCYYDNDPSNE